MRLPTETLHTIADYTSDVTRVRLGMSCKDMAPHLQIETWSTPGVPLARTPHLRVLRAIPHFPERNPNRTTHPAQHTIFTTMRWKCLALLPLLQELDLSDSNVDDLDMHGIAEFVPHVRILKLVRTDVRYTSWCLPPLERCVEPQQEYMDCHHPQYGGTETPRWPSLRALHLGSIWGSYNFNNRVAYYMPRLSHLCIESCVWTYLAIDAWQSMRKVKIRGAHDIIGQLPADLRLDAAQQAGEGLW